LLSQRARKEESKVQESYWKKVLNSRLSRRRALAVSGATAASAAFLAACGGDGNGNGGTSGGETAKKDAPDPMSGKPGGEFIWQGYGDVGGSTEMVRVRNAGIHQLAGLTHDALYEFDNGKPQHDPTTNTVSPNLALALPEQSPDQLTYTIKLKQGVNFHNVSPTNGREMTSEDVKYTFETYAQADFSAFKNDYVWFDSIQAPDKYTVVIKTKFPFADTIQALAGKDDGEILAREHVEGPDSAKTLVGTGPYIFVSYDAPNFTTYRKNPDYHIKGLPYFDTIKRTGNADPEKKLADFVSHGVHMSYWFPEEDRDRIKAQRSDAQVWSYDVPAETVSMRTDKPPFNDKRVRQAFSMAIDRNLLIQTLTKGEAEADQWLSWTGKAWNFRRPKDLGANAKYYQHNVAEAKALMSAAGVDTIRAELPYWSPAVIGQKYVDQIVLMMTSWKNAGIGDFRGVEFTHAQFASGPLLGNYDLITWHPNVTAIQAKIGLSVRNGWAWAPGAPKQAPTLNRGWVEDLNLTALVEKQLTQFDKEARKATFREIEDVLAAEQYAIVGVTHKTTWFGDPSLKNTQPAIEMYNGGTHYMKYWWFDKA
jgi:ABC-type transport system substrate-binding protein